MKQEDFKNFVRTKPELIKFVQNGEMTWQKFYELYDLYGEKEDVWKKYMKEDQINIKGLFNTLKNINLDSLEENITSIQKAVGLVEELTKPEEKEEVSSKEEKIDKLYGE